MVHFTSLSVTQNVEDSSTCIELASCKNCIVWMCIINAHNVSIVIVVHIKSLRIYDDRVLKGIAWHFGTVSVIDIVLQGGYVWFIITGNCGRRYVMSVLSTSFDKIYQADLTILPPRDSTLDGRWHLHNQLILCSIHLLFFVKMRIF